MCVWCCVMWVWCVCETCLYVVRYIYICVCVYLSKLDVSVFFHQIVPLVRQEEGFPPVSFWRPHNELPFPLDLPTSFHSDSQGTSNQDSMVENCLSPIVLQFYCCHPRKRAFKSFSKDDFHSSLDFILFAKWHRFCINKKKNSKIIRKLSV